MNASDPELFATLDQVPWAELTHAYGSAADLPDQLRMILSPKAKVRERAFESFFGNIFHQGTVYPATVAAIPFFIEALQHPQVADRWRILSLLAYLAVGYPTDCLLRGFRLKELLSYGDPLQPGKFIDEVDGDEIPVDPEYGDLVRQCYAAVGAGCPVYASLLEAPSPGLRHSAAFLLAWFPAHGWSATPRLLQLAQEDSSPLVRCGCLLALSQMAGPRTRPTFLHLAESMVTLVGASRAPNAPVPALDAAACYCLLREKYLTRDRQVPEPWRQLAEACLQAGIDYGSLASPEEPTVEFHWDDLTGHLQKVIRKLMKKPKRRRNEADDE